MSPIDYFTVKYGAHNDIAVVSSHRIIPSVGVIDILVQLPFLPAIDMPRGYAQFASTHVSKLEKLDLEFVYLLKEH